VALEQFDTILAFSAVMKESVFQDLIAPSSANPKCRGK